MSLVPPFAIALPGEAVSIGTFCWQNYTATFCSKSLYFSCATDWPGVSVGHPTGALAIFCQWVLWHGWLTLLCEVLSWGVLLSIVLYPHLLLGSSNSTHRHIWSPIYGIWFVIKRHDSYSWYRFWTIKALVEAVALNDGFSVICRGMVAPLIIARLLFVQ